MPEETKRETGISKMIGFNDEQEKNLSERFKYVFREQVGKNIFKEGSLYDYELEKTEKEKQIIADILERIGSFVEKYGGIPVDITPNQIHILDEAKFGETRKKYGIPQEQVGWYYSIHQMVCLIAINNNVQFAQRLVHELLHFNSFQSVESEEKSSTKCKIRRVGFEISSKKKNKKYFTWLNEAVIEELAKRFDSQHFNSINAISYEFKEREKHRSYFKEAKEAKEANDIFLVKTNFSNKTSSLLGYSYAYKNERKKLHGIIQKIYEKNKGQFDSVEDVFNVFAKAAMDGRLLNVARLIKKTFPKSFLRKLGESMDYC